MNNGELIVHDVVDGERFSHVEGANCKICGTREPYVYLMCQLRGTTMTHLFEVPEEKMGAYVAEWQENINKPTGTVMTFDTGIDGVWHVLAEDILFFKRITQAEVNELRAQSVAQANAARARLLGR